MPRDRTPPGVYNELRVEDMRSMAIFWAGWRRLNTVWADLPLRVKGLIVVAIPLAALLESTFSFYLIQRADREADTWVQRSSQFVDALESGLAELLDGEAAVHEYLITERKERLARLVAVNDALSVDLTRLEGLLRNEPAQLERLGRVRKLVQDETRIWVEMSAAADQDARIAIPRSTLFRRSQASMDALRTELYFMRGEQERMLATRVESVAEVRRLALAAVAGGTLLGLGGGILAIWLFTSGVARGVNRLEQNTARLRQGLPVLPSICGRDELGRLESELQKVSVSLLKSEEERDRFFTLSLDMLCIATLDGHFKRVNPAFTRTLGHSEAEFLAKSILDFVHPDDREATAAQLQELARGNPMAYFENRLRCADGSYKWVVWSSAPVLADGMAFAVARDNTRQKLAEQDLRQSNARLSWVLESTTDAFFALDGGWHFTYVNPEAERLLRRTGEDLLGRNIFETFPAAGKFYRRYQQAGLSGVAVHFEEFYAPFNQWLEVHAYPSVEGLSVYFRDITKRRQTDESIRRSLHEKEVLLREIHHRVKNNLQVVCSMLRLQAGHIHDQRLSEVLTDCCERVHAMAMLHDQLHRAKDLSSINMGQYIRSLAASLFCSYGVNSARIALRMDVDAIPVAIDIAIPCGLIVHELVSNALRHAFPEGAGGHVSLGLHVDRDGRIELTVSDNGIGFSEASCQADTRSLGLRLVYLLAEQLEAIVECSGKAGTQHRFLFKPKKSKENESNEQASHPVGRG
jgi:PAS domain S-box-containing protein